MSATAPRRAHATPPPLPTRSGQLADTVQELLWFGDDDPARTQEQASGSLAAAVAEATGLKPFPTAAAQLIRVLVTPDYRMRDVERIVRQDPAFTTKLLRVANSPIFRRGAACDSIESAVMRMGSRNVLEVVAAVASMSMFEDLDGYALDVRNHSIAVANIGRVLAEWWGFQGGAQLALCGLLHDIGKLLSVQCGEIPYHEMPESALHSVDEVHILERQMTGYDHAVLGGHVLLQWGIPEPVPQVVSWHHQQARAYAHGGEIGIMVAMLRLADRIAAAIVANKTLDDERLDWIMRDGSAAFLEVNAPDIRGQWDSLVLASATSLTG